MILLALKSCSLTSMMRFSKSSPRLCFVMTFVGRVIECPLPSAAAFPTCREGDKVLFLVLFSRYVSCSTVGSLGYSSKSMVT